MGAEAGGGMAVDPAEPSAARLPGRGAAAPDWTRPANRAESEAQVCLKLLFDLNRSFT